MERWVKMHYARKVPWSGADFCKEDTSLSPCDPE